MACFTIYINFCLNYFNQNKIGEFGVSKSVNNSLLVSSEFKFKPSKPMLIEVFRRNIKDIKIISIHIFVFTTD
jgi:hypothetical protein